MALFPGAANFLDRIIFHPCARPWFIYVLTALPAFLVAIVTVRWLDWADLMRMSAGDFAREKMPRTGRGGGHSIRQKMQDGKEGRKHWSQKGLSHVLAATAPIELFGLAVLLLFAADRFFFNWQALLEAWNYCEGDPASGPFQRSRNDANVLVGGLLYETLLQNRSGWGNNAASVSVPAGLISAVATLNIGYHGTGTHTWTLSLQVTDTGFPVSDASSSLTLAEGQTGDLIVVNTFFVPLGATLAWVLSGPPVPTGLSSTGGRVFVMRDQPGASA